MPTKPLLLAGQGRPKPLADRAPSFLSAGSRISLLLRALLHDDQLSQVGQNASIDHYDDFEVVGSERGVEPPTVFCGPCRDVLKKAAERGFSSPRDRRPPYDTSPIPHHKDLLEFYACCHSPGGSCHLCQILWHAYQTEMLYLRETGVRVQTEWRGRGLEISIDAPETSGLPSVRSIRLNIFPALQVEAKLSDEIENGCFPELGESTDSIETFNQIKHWMHYCTKNHTECQMEQGLPSELPTRLVEIEACGSFRLTTNFPGDFRYTALSYRWGSDTSYTLRAETEAQMREGVSIAELPKTLRDACTITSRLGIKYIWIDRLCIFQDCTNDWAHEASKMAQVYRNATCTIFAACSSNEQGGCFRRRKASRILPLNLKSSPLSWGRVIISKYTYWHEKLGYLSNRGWIFQERNLSRRILYFARDEVHWECGMGLFSEVCPSFESLRDHSKRRLAAYSRGNWIDRARSWAEIVHQYSSKSLTYESDKLPALSGMAQAMQTPSNDQYLAGLWKQTLLLDLCWEVDPEIVGQRTKIYQAPSWSWASLASGVWYRRIDESEETTYLATVKEAHVEPVGENPMGQVRHGQITLSGHLQPVQLQWAATATGSEAIIIMRFDGTPIPGRHPQRYSARLDTAEIWPQGGKSMPAYLLALLHHSDCTVRGLLLVPCDLHKGLSTSLHSVGIQSGQRRVYRRVGFVKLLLARFSDFQREKMLAWVSEAALQDVVIV